MPSSALLRAYLAASHVTGPIYRLWQRRALRRGKEDPARTEERWGRTARPRPEGTLIWFHAASVGETQSILPLISSLLEARGDLRVLVTSTTRTSAQMLARDLPEGAFHQVAPYDTVAATRRFLDHWRPDAAVWVESELWPRMLKETAARDIPMFLINARVSARTAVRWKRFAATARGLLAPFRAVHVQEQVTLDAMRDVGVTGPQIRLTGALKEDRGPLACDAEELGVLKGQIGARDVWCASSTHPGEDEIVLEAHRAIGDLLILAPRHAERAGDIRVLAKEMGLSVAQRSREEAITPQTDVYLADTLGEMGLWYRLAPVSFVAGSITPVGGHNPYEPAQLGSAILHGPHVGNFAGIYARLSEAGASLQIADAASLAQGVGAARQKQAAMVAAAKSVVQQQGGASAAAKEAILQVL